MVMRTTTPTTTMMMVRVMMVMTTMMMMMMVMVVVVVVVMVMMVVVVMMVVGLVMVMMVMTMPSMKLWLLLRLLLVGVVVGGGEYDCGDGQAAYDVNTYHVRTEAEQKQQSSHGSRFGDSLLDRHAVLLRHLRDGLQFVEHVQVHTTDSDKWDGGFEEESDSDGHPESYRLLPQYAAPLSVGSLWVIRLC